MTQEDPELTSSRHASTAAGATTSSEKDLKLAERLPHIDKRDKSHLEAGGRG